MGIGDFFDSIGKTFKSLGGAVAAPYTTVYDLGSTEFHDAQHGDYWNFGDYVHVLAHNGNKILDPFKNDQTWTGYAIGHTMDGLNWLGHEMSRTAATPLYVVAHADAGKGFLGDDWGRLVDPQSWSKAWQLANAHGIGNALTWADSRHTGGIGGFNTFDPSNDPMTAGLAPSRKGRLNQFDELMTHRDAQIFSTASMFVLGWYADPGVLIGKSAGLLRNEIALRHLGESDRSSLSRELTEGPAKRAGVKVFIPRLKPLQARVDSAFHYTLGNNALKRPLTTTEIEASMKPMLGSESGTYANLWSQTIHDPEMSLQDKAATVRKIVAVAGGDQHAILAIQGEIPQAKKIADALSNLDKRSTVELTLQELDKDARFSPDLIGDFQRQLTNLDDTGDVSKFVGTWLEQQAEKFSDKQKFYSRLSDIGGTADHVPGASPAGPLARALPLGKGAADKAILRQNHLNPANRLATVFQQSREGQSTLWQKSLDQMPLMVAKSADVLTSPWLKSYAFADNALRQTHYIGVANLHDWAGSTDQLDSMLRLLHADDPTRMGAMEKAFAATSEIEKRAAINHVESVAMTSYAAHLSAKYGRDIDADYVRNLVMNGQFERGRALSGIENSKFSATSIPVDSPLRQAGMNTLDTTAAVAGKLQTRVPEDSNFNVDMFDTGDGVPTHLPLMEAQLANKVPLLDAHLIRSAFADEYRAARLAELSHTWKTEALELGRLMKGVQGAKAGHTDALIRAIRLKQQAMDGLTEAGHFLTKAWKVSVLLRLGYPQRILLDDNARIFAALGSGTHFISNGKEAGAAWWDNRAPAFIRKGGRKATMAMNYQATTAERKDLIEQYGFRRPHSDEDFAKVTDAAATTMRKRATAAEKAGAQATLDKLDPEGNISSYYQNLEEIAAMKRSAKSLRGNITRWRNALDAPGGAEAGDAAEIRKKIALAEGRIAEHEGGIASKQDMLPERSPNELRLELKATNDMLIRGKKAFRDPKRRIGDTDVPLDVPGIDPATGKPWAAKGAFAAPYGDAYRSAANSNGIVEHVINQNEARRTRAIRSGNWKTFAPDDAGHIYTWEHVLNHQLRNSSVAMWHARHPEGTVGEFKSWLNEPGQAHLHERLPHLAHDPEAWYHRLKPMVDELLTENPEVREIVAHGRISVNQLKRLVAQMDRPAVHGAALDYNVGGNAAARMAGNATNRVMGFLAEMPTDHLSRQPFFNTIYKREVREMARLRSAAVRDAGRQFDAEDMRYIERQARRKALAHVKAYLWDISAHSNAAHMLRFVSPFFAAHQEALNRWWRIAKEDPSVVRRFQLAFDAPRYAGLTYDPSTGEPVKPGESISPNHRIMIRIPWQGDSSVLNKFLRRLGGEKYWSINENGLNVMLQGGLTNPGTGPLVSFPAKVLADTYANDPDVLKMANVLTGGYMPETKAGAVLPSWAQKAVALATHNGQYDAQMWQNYADRLKQFEDHNGRAPRDDENDSMLSLAAHDTNRDLWLEMTSNIVGLTPARPNSRYAAIQNGVSRIRSQAEAQGKDFEWIKKTVAQKYGPAIDMFVTSSSSNPGGFTGTPAEVNAVKKYKDLIGKVDPALTRMVIGPDAVAKGQAGQYNSESRHALETMTPTKGSDQTLIQAKDPRQMALGAIADQGWDQYDELTNWLTLTAKNQGLASFYDSPQLMDLYHVGKQQLLDHNFAFRTAWTEASTSEKYAGYVDDMRQIVSAKQLNDASRPDIGYLKQYLQVRDWVTAVLKQRDQTGGSAEPTANANQPLMQFFTKYVVALNDQSSYFKKYDYAGVIEHDPYLLGVQ